MTFLKITALTGVACLAAFLGYKYFTADPPGYCAAQQRYITDAEFIKKSEALYARGIKDQLERQTRWAAENPDQSLTNERGYVNSSFESFQRWQADIEKNRNRPSFIRVERNSEGTIYRWLWGYRVEVLMNANSVYYSFFFYNECGKLRKTDLPI